MNTVLTLLQAKGTRVWTTTPDASIFAAIQLMAEKNVGALVVLEAERPVGIISERDYARKVALQGKASRETPVSEIMTRGLVTVTPDQTVHNCMTLMTEKHVRHLPVLEQGRLVGIISIGDVVEDIIAELSAMVRYLEDYITGKR